MHPSGTLWLLHGRALPSSRAGDKFWQILANLSLENSYLELRTGQILTRSAHNWMLAAKLTLSVPPGCASVVTFSLSPTAAAVRDWKNSELIKKLPGTRLLTEWGLCQWGNAGDSQCFYLREAGAREIQIRIEIQDFNRLVLIHEGK